MTNAIDSGIGQIHAQTMFYVIQKNELGVLNQKFKNFFSSIKELGEEFNFSISNVIEEVFKKNTNDISHFISTAQESSVSLKKNCLLKKANEDLEKQKGEMYKIDKGTPSKNTAGVKL